VLIGRLANSNAAKIHDNDDLASANSNAAKIHDNDDLAIQLLHSLLELEK
jgi:hypothetical protein